MSVLNSHKKQTFYSILFKTKLYVESIKSASTTTHLILG